MESTTPLSCFSLRKGEEGVLEWKSGQPTNCEPCKACAPSATSYGMLEGK